MKIRLAFIFMLIGVCGQSFPAPASAETAILRCRIVDGDREAELSLDMAGAAELKELTKKRRKENLDCHLKIEWISDDRQGIDPGIRFVFSRSSCVHHSQLEQHLTKKIQFVVTSDRGKSKGFIQWVNDRQPTPCTLTHLDSNALQLILNGWKEQRRTSASR